MPKGSGEQAIVALGCPSGYDGHFALKAGAVNSSEDRAFHLMAGVVAVRHIQQPFAFEWDVDEDGNDERKLLERYVAGRGALCRSPVLLTGTYRADTAMHIGVRLPWGVYFPEKAITACFANGRIDWKRLEAEENEGRSLDQGVCNRTIEIAPAAIVSADTTLVDFIHEPPDGFEQTGAIVLDGSRWTGVVTSHELMSAPARMCLLAMTLELESAATELCRLFPVECFTSLTESRKKKAVETLLQRLTPGERNAIRLGADLTRMAIYSGGTDTPESALASLASVLIDATHFSDKPRMICKCRLTIELSNTRVRSVFGRAQRLRNRCAHPGLESDKLPCSFAELVDLVKDCAEISSVFAESFAAEARVRKIAPPHDS